MRAFGDPSYPMTRPASTSDGDCELVAGRDALRRHAWREALEHFRAADAIEPLSAEDLERLAEAAVWIGRLDDAIATRERAHAAYLERGNPRRAGSVALELGHNHSPRARGPWQRAGSGAPSASSSRNGTASSTLTCSGREASRRRTRMRRWLTREPRRPRDSIGRP